MLLGQVGFTHILITSGGGLLPIMNDVTEYLKIKL